MKGVPAKTVYMATVLAILTFAAGFALAAAFSVTNGPNENGNGNYEATGSIPWWTQSAVGLSSVPVTVPTALSSAVATPTTLAATGQLYMINAGTVGDLDHFFKFTESPSAVASTELEVTFTISTGSTPTPNVVTVYVEMQATVPTSAQTYTLAYDLGSAASGTIVLDSFQQLSQQCSSVGSCP
ncbi:MAG: hypothetical protein L3K18_01875 [Thermoplasmata archaeon]|nr:hypothetical protein [Thermoplasmata archaeon]MCI4355878.1 hypothetical protein [Thermoplasmata archaeon]